MGVTRWNAFSPSPMGFPGQPLSIWRCPTAHPTFSVWFRGLEQESFGSKPLQSREPV